MKSFKIHTLKEDIKSKLRRLKNLSRSENDELLSFFKSNPHLEGKQGGINWNDRNLSYDDFQQVKNSVSRSKIKRNVKKYGIKGLKENKDYIDISYLFENYQAYIPLNYDASMMFGSKYIGSCEGKWCTSSNRPATWNDYTSRGVVIIILISNDGKKKYAVATHDRLMDVEIFDEKNKEINSVPNEDVKNIVRDNKREIVAFNRKIKQHKYFSAKWIEKAQTDDAEYEITADNEIHWSYGIWIKGNWIYGEWEDGMWLDGTWRDGIWHKGIWKKGKWEYGTWHDGTWQNGLWVSGDHKDGTWEDGDWLYGIWWDGIWEGGTWHGGAWVDGEWLGGKWKGGYDQNKEYHEEDDSPDKW